MQKLDAHVANNNILAGIKFIFCPPMIAFLLLYGLSNKIVGNASMFRLIQYHIPFAFK